MMSFQNGVRCSGFMSVQTNRVHAAEVADKPGRCSIGAQPVQNVVFSAAIPLPGPKGSAPDQYRRRTDPHVGVSSGKYRVPTLVFSAALTMPGENKLNTPRLSWSGGMQRQARVAVRGRSTRFPRAQHFPPIHLLFCQHPLVYVLPM